MFRILIFFLFGHSIAMNEQISNPRHVTSLLTISSRPRSMIDITSEIDSWLKEINAATGLITIFVKHTSASLTIQENTDVDVQHDLLDVLDDLAPAENNWRHSLEGSDDMPAHVKSVLVGSNQAIPVVNGRMDLGTWQAVYLVEHRTQSHQRLLSLHYAGY